MGKRENLYPAAKPQNRSVKCSSGSCVADLLWDCPIFPNHAWVLRASACDYRHRGERPPRYEGGLEHELRQVRHLGRPREALLGEALRSDQGLPDAVHLIHPM